MKKNMEFNGKIVELEFVLPQKVKDFLAENNLAEESVLKNYNWERCIEEDLFQREMTATHLKIVINYIHITQETQIRVNPEDFASGEALVSPSWSKGTFSEEFSIGYSIFA